ncbi:unnamed protein product [Prunus armeniaca]|uniref:Uncharacterized protein n=1 Tax=Prunus armeniaca TaxID=36596 RepID=A0A6J5URH5_PRUAR|nr:unnamed protein product [Prunus armeniaca]
MGIGFLPRKLGYQHHHPISHLYPSPTSKNHPSSPELASPPGAGIFNGPDEHYVSTIETKDILNKQYSFKN